MTLPQYRLFIINIIIIFEDSDLSKNKIFKKLEILSLFINLFIIVTHVGEMSQR